MSSRPGQHAQRRRLATPRRPDEHHELAVLDVEVEVVDGARAVGVDLRHAVERHSCHAPLALLPGQPGRRSVLPLNEPRRNQVSAADAPRTLLGWRQPYTPPTPLAEPLSKVGDDHTRTTPGADPHRAHLAPDRRRPLPGQARARRGRRRVGDARARRPRGARRRAALPARRGAALARGADDGAPRGSRPLARVVHGRCARALAVRRRRLGRPRRLLAARARAQGRRRPERSRERAVGGRRAARRSRADGRGGPRRRLRRPLRADGRPSRRSSSSSMPSAPPAAPGTSSSRARGAASPASRSSCPSSPSSASTCSTCRRSTPSGAPHRKGRNNSPTARRSDPGSPWAIGGGGRRARCALAPRPRQRGGVREPRRRRARGRDRDRARLRDPVLPRPPLAEASTRTGSTGGPTARSSTPRTRPSVPGHLQRQLRHRGLARALERAPRRRAALGRSGRHGVPRRQPAHEADRLLGVADRRGAGGPSRDGLPGRGVHAPGADGDAREGRLQPVLHVLHVAQHEGRADRVHDAADAVGAAAVLPPELLRQHARHPPRLPRAGRPAGLRGAARAGRDALAGLRHLLGLRALRERAADRVERGVPQLREVRDQEALAGRSAAADDRAPQRRAPRESGAAAARQHHVPRDRERGR